MVVVDHCHHLLAGDQVPDAALLDAAGGLVGLLPLRGLPTLRPPLLRLLRLPRRIFRPATNCRRPNANTWVPC